MHPTLFSLNLGATTITVSSYGLFLVTGGVVACLVAVFLGRRRGLPSGRTAVVLAAMLVGLFVGARLLHLVLNRGFYAEDPGRLSSLSFSGFSLYGGLLAAAGAGIVLAHRLRLPLWRLGDVTVVGAGVGIALARVGCFLNGCCFGTACDLPWAVRFPVGSRAWAYQLVAGELGNEGANGASEGAVDALSVLTLAANAHPALPVHPTQLYELFAGLAAAGLALTLMHLSRRDTRGPGSALFSGGRPALPDGVPFLAAALLFTAFRAGNWFLRVPPSTYDVGDWFYPLFYAALVVLIVALLVVRVRAREGEAHLSSADRWEQGDSVSVSKLSIQRSLAAVDHGDRHSPTRDAQ